MKNKPLIDKDGEVRELTKADMRKFRPAREVVPHIVAAHKSGTLKVRGRPRSSTKTPVSLRLDDEILAFFKKKGDGWQTRINDTLKAIVDATH